MLLHSGFQALHTTLRAMQMPGDALYKAAILITALLLLLTAGM